MRGRSRTTTEAMPESMPDATLVAQALIDRRAFGHIFDRYWDAIFRFCYFRIGDWHRAEDAASQVFERALAGLERFAETDRAHNLRAWLFGIARNRSAAITIVVPVRDHWSLPLHPPPGLACASDQRHEGTAPCGNTPKAPDPPDWPSATTPEAVTPAREP